jgi:hypothetical protein
MPQNFVAIQSTNYKVITQHTVWRIQCVNRDEQWWTDVDGWMFVDGRQWTERAERMTLNKNWTDVKRMSNGNQTKAKRTLNEHQTNIKQMEIGRKLDEHQTNRCSTDVGHNDHNTTKHPWTLKWWGKQWRVNHNTTKGHELCNNGEHNATQQPRHYEATVSSATWHDNHGTMMWSWAS